MLLTVNLYRNFIDVEGIAVASVFSFQATGINGSEFYAPQANRFTADCDTALSQEVLDVAVAQVEALVEPDGVRDNIWRESVVLVCIHRQIVSFRRVNLAVPVDTTTLTKNHPVAGY
jgi:hypothetical protein